jgi:allophanate hydrolase subunit 2
MGPQDDLFKAEGIATFLSSEYTVTPHADRMGVRLAGPAITHLSGADIISDGIPAGAVQVPGDGQPIVMLADRQTTGGYPKIACVIRSDRDLIAQARPGDRVRFKKVSLEEAQRPLADVPLSDAVERAFKLRIGRRSYQVRVTELR